MKRTKHSLSHYHLFTGDMGYLIPAGVYEVLPGDTVQQATSLLLRASPLLTPVMHPVSVRVHHWFVPYRILWDEWEDFITGGDTSAFPSLNAPLDGWPAKSLADYFGIRPGSTYSINALPFYAYNRIWNEFYRDQDLQVQIADNNTAVAQVAWEKDYFTSARPWPQKGDEVTVPVKGFGQWQDALGNYDFPNAPVLETGTGITAFPHGQVINPGVAKGTFIVEGTAASGGLPKVRVDVDDLKLAFALQRYQEARARYGSRYVEYLRYLGVRSSDARLQRPEYLGGGKQTISFSEVLQTGPDADGDGVATMRGHGIAALRTPRYRRFFEEHGVVITLMSVRPRALYGDSLHRMWLNATKEDFFQKELENIGDQPVFNAEVRGATFDANTVFGWQDRYAQYRTIHSRVSSDFRTTLNDWHFARIFSADPVLNSDFIRCDPAKRPFAVQDEDVMWVMANHSIQARRMVGRGART